MHVKTPGSVINADITQPIPDEDESMTSSKGSQKTKSNQESNQTPSSSHNSSSSEFIEEKESLDDQINWEEK